MRRDENPIFDDFDHYGNVRRWRHGHRRARLHADEARRHVGKPSVDLAARQLLAQNDGAHLVEADEVERILADVDAYCRNGSKAGGLAWQGCSRCGLPRATGLR